MSDSTDDPAGKRGEGRKPKRGGLPSIVMFLGVLFGLVLLLESFTKAIQSTDHLDYDQFLRELYTGNVVSVTQHGDTRLTGKYMQEPAVENGPQQQVNFVVDLPPGEMSTIGGGSTIGGMTTLSTELRDLVNRAPSQIREDDLLKKLENPAVRAAKAWLVPVREGKNGDGRDRDRLFVDLYDGSEPLARCEVEPPPGHGVNVPVVQKALDRFNVRIERRGVRPGKEAFQYEPENTFLMSLVINLVPWLLIFGVLWFFIFRQMRSPGGAGGVLSFGRARATLIGKERTGVTFDDVAGIDEAKDEVKEIVEFLKDPARFSRIGARIPRGVLLVGAPGTGKTLLAKAIAGEANVPFFSISGSDFVEMFVGVGASRVRDLFRQAREKTPCLIFLDEIDAVGRRRGSGLGGGHDEREQTLNAILVEMDGFETDEGIILVAATNRPDVLDPALLRPGRFDRQIVIDLPDVKGREAILKVHVRHVPLDHDVDLAVVARATPGFSGAEIASLVNEAALRATLLGRDRVNLADFEEARDRIRFGREKTGRAQDEKERRKTAYHEAGHALVGHLHEGVEPLHKVTIVPRGMSLGATFILPEKDRYTRGREQMIGEICFAFGGRIAEELFCGDISSGAYDDIRKATETARNMVTLFGMSEKLGPVNYAEQDAVFLGGEIVRNKNYSEETATIIDNEVRRIVDECYQEAKRLIVEHKETVEKIAAALLKYETIHLEELVAIVAGATPEEARASFDRSHPLPPPKLKPPRSDTGADARARPLTRPEEGLPPAGEPAVP
jgi:cell division protease FtsH